MEDFGFGLDEHVAHAVENRMSLDEFREYIKGTVEWNRPFPAVPIPDHPKPKYGLRYRLSVAWGAFRHPEYL